MTVIVYICPTCGSARKKVSTCSGTRQRRHAPIHRVKKIVSEEEYFRLGFGPSSLPSSHK